MMEISDELFTPGCPQCAVKHLSAALFYGARVFALYGEDSRPRTENALLAQAYVNLGEVLIGYKSHLWYAVGLLQVAEETALLDGRDDVAMTAREARLHLEETGLDGAGKAMAKIDLNVPLMPDALRDAHIREATRELPNFPWGRYSLHDATGLVEAIEEIRSEYFAGPTVGPEQGETTTETGDRKMATAKKTPAKKAACKGTKCACKGGKTKKGK